MLTSNPMSTTSAGSPLAAARAPERDALEISGTAVRIARLSDEWYQDLDDPESYIQELKRNRVRADLFTFWQRLPDTEPRYPYHREWEPIAALPVSTYEHWYKNVINNKTRNLIVKAAKKGVVVRRAVFDDDFVRGMTAIFNETPIRQERRFLHYGKSFETVKREFARFLFREELVGAYAGDELIGFVFMGNAGRYASLGQIISAVRHRDKSPTNALVAKAIEICAERGISHLVYALWPRGPLRDFKKHNGFEEVRLPRYYVPLTTRGALSLKLGLHRGVTDRLPDDVLMYLRGIRSKYYARRYNR